MSVVSDQCNKHIESAAAIYPNCSISLIVVGDYFTDEAMAQVEQAFRGKCAAVLCGTRDGEGIKFVDAARKN